MKLSANMKIAGTALDFVNIVELVWEKKLTGLHLSFLTFINLCCMNHAMSWFQCSFSKNALSILRKYLNSHRVNTIETGWIKYSDKDSSLDPMALIVPLRIFITAHDGPKRRQMHVGMIPRTDITETTRTTQRKMTLSSWPRSFFINITVPSSLTVFWLKIAFKHCVPYYTFRVLK